MPSSHYPTAKSSHVSSRHLHVPPSFNHSWDASLGLVYKVDLKPRERNARFHCSAAPSFLSANSLSIKFPPYLEHCLPLNLNRKRIGLGLQDQISVPLFALEVFVICPIKKLSSCDNVTDQIPPIYSHPFHPHPLPLIQPTRTSTPLLPPCVHSNSVCGRGDHGEKAVLGHIPMPILVSPRVLFIRPDCQHTVRSKPLSANINTTGKIGKPDRLADKG